MVGISTYRTLLSAAVLAAVVLALPACAGTDRTTMKQQQYSKWNLTRIGVLAQLAQQQYEVGDYDKCRETLKQGFAVDEPSPQLHIIAARVEIEKGNLELAADHLKQALQVDGNDPLTYYLLGVVYQRWQNFTTARDYYQLAWDHKPNDVRYLLAVIEMDISLGQYDEAETVAQAKVMYFEESAALRLALARLRLMKGDYPGACRYYAEASILNPDSLSIKQSYAETLFAAQRYSDALPLFEQVAASSEVSDKSIVRVELAETYLQLRRARDARDCLLDVTREDPHLIVAWVDLGKAELQLNDAAEALRALDVALKNDPDNVSALVVQALAQQQLEQWEALASTLDHAAKVAPNNPTVLCLRGLQAQQQGAAAAARALYDQALAANPADPMARELVARLGAEGR